MQLDTTKIPLSMEFSRQEYWSGLLLPSPEDLLDPGTGPMSLVSATLADRFFTTRTTWETPNKVRGEGKSWGVFQKQQKGKISSEPSGACHGDVHAHTEFPWARFIASPFVHKHLFCFWQA